MSLIHNPSIVTNGLIMYYDMNNTLKSFKGGPTTNVLTNTNLDTGWSQGYNTSIIIGDTSVGFPPGVNSQVVSFIDANADGFGYWYSYGDYAPQADNTTYSVSVWAMTSGANWVIQPYTADNSEANRVWLTAKTVIGNGVWQRLEWPNAFTTGSGWDSDSLSFQFNSIAAGQRCWLCAPQMEPLSYCTPFVEGTRSNTQAIVDLTGRNAITATSLTYNSDGSFSFANSTDVIDIPSTSLFNLTSVNFSIEMWLYINTSVDTSGVYHGLVEIGSSGSTFLLGIWRSGLFPGCLYNTFGGATMFGTDGSGGYSGANYKLSGKWTHVVFTRNSSTSYFYLNGNLWASRGTPSIPNTSNNLKIGYSPSAGNFPGIIPVFRFYKSRALSDT